MPLDPRLSSELQRGLVIPACPLALTAQRRFDERRQRALIRYYLASEPKRAFRGAMSVLPLNRQSLA